MSIGKVLSVKQLHERLGQMVDAGDGDLPVMIPDYPPDIEWIPLAEVEIAQVLDDDGLTANWCVQLS